MNIFSANPNNQLNNNADAANNLDSAKSQIISGLFWAAVKNPETAGSVINAVNGSGGGSASGGGGLLDIAKGFFASPEARNQASIAAMKEIEKFKAFVQEGHWSWKILASTGGLALTGSAAFCSLGDFFTLDIIGLVFDLFMLVFGIIIVLLEYKDTLMPPAFNDYIKEEFLFIYKPYGRALIYFFLGILLFTQFTFPYIFVGPYLAVAGAIIWAASSSTHKELTLLKEKVVDKMALKHQFNTADKNKDGKLDSTEFMAFCHSVGIEMNINDCEVALLELDENHDGVITWDEFIAWYTRK